MYVKSYTSVISGIEAVTVTVEANISNGIGMFLVGLPDNAVRESQERIRAAFSNCGYRMTGRRLVVNLAPADLRKEGSSLDLPIAVAILAASGQLDGDAAEKWMITGELSLDGTLKAVKGALPMAINAMERGFKGIILPAENAEEAAVAGPLEVIPVKTLTETVAFLCGNLQIEPYVREQATEEPAGNTLYGEDMSDVRGQQHVKRALEIAAAGGHNVIMIGSPGSGKTMMARRVPSILPPLDGAESLETTRIHSVAGKLGAGTGLMVRRPFRAPHHLASRVALVGGGTNPQPGEISLAHNGVLFLDELPEFGRALLEVLRQPLEDRTITVSRARYSVEYPANFMLMASMNPCPCGYHNHPVKECQCTAGAVDRYMNRISGPLMDRIDMHIEVSPVEFRQMSSGVEGETSAAIREHVVEARRIQAVRFADCEGVHTNAMMNSRMIREFCRLDAAATALLGTAMERLDLSARAYDRIVKLARTIADLAGESDILPAHIAEAINYRSLDRNGLN